jgi:hypothetical protein
MSANYLQELKDNLDGPSCHVCGAIMVKDWRDQHDGSKGYGWKCLSCKTTTGCEAPPETRE